MKDISMHIMDIAQNSITAGAGLLEINIIEDIDNDAYTVIIKDNGKGMPEELLKKVTDPFTTTRTTRKIGLGLPLLKQNVERTGGTFSIESKEGEGTTVEASFVMMHPDRLPIGDIAGTIVLLTSANPELTIIYRHSTNTGDYEYNTTEINSTLDGVSITEPSVIRFLKEMIDENLQSIGISR